MKKIGDIIKPFISIIFGALLFLVYLNYLSTGGTTLAIGIIGVILAAYYLAVGIVATVLGDKMPGGVRDILDLVSIVLFPTFMFVVFLIRTINVAQANALLPTGWVISITSMTGALLMVVAYLLAKLLNIKLLTRFAFMFSAIFILALLLDIIFDSTGLPIVLGNINIIGLVIYLVYTYMLFNSFAKDTQKAE